MLRSQIQQRQRRADVVVEISLGLEHPEFGAQNGGHHLLGGGLAHGAGDLDHRDVVPVPAASGQGPQGQTGIRHLDIEFPGQEVFRHLGTQAPGGTRFQGRVNKPVPVVPLSFPGNKQGPGLHLPTVRTYRGYRGKVLPRRQQAAAHCGLDLLDRHWLHRNLHAHAAHF